MKTLLSYAAIAVFIMASSFTIDNQRHINNETVTSQPNNCFNYFRAHRQARGVAMTWSVGASNVIQFVVERSYDDYYWEPAGSVSSNGATSYKFNDNSIFPGTIYYRVQALKTDGTTECSATEIVRIVQRN
jgi:hypothetical protein